MGMSPHLLVSKEVYQARLDARYGEGRVVALAFKGRGVEVRHYFTLVNAMAKSTPWQMLQQFTKNPERVTGIDPNKLHIRSLKTYQQELDSIYGKQLVNIQEFRGMYTPVLHTCHLGSFTKTPSQVVSGVRKSLTMLLRSRYPTFNSTADYQKALDSAYGVNIITACDYRGSTSKVDHVLKVSGKTIKRTPTALLEHIRDSIKTGSTGREKYKNDREYHDAVSKHTGGNIACTHEYRNANYEHTFKCLRCRTVWSLMTHGLDSKLGCPQCDRVHGYSLVAVEWLNTIARRKRIVIQHVLNGGEYCLPGTRIRVDGFHHRSKTVYEFHGDVYHGNPQTCSPRSKPHPFSKKTARQLYKETINRENKIRSLGYNLVVVWEADYRRGCLYSN